MDYDKLTADEAQDILKNHDEVSDDEYDELETYIEDPVSVLYWLDADGDFEQAVRIQGLPRDVPIKVARALADTDYDLLAHHVNTSEPEERTCAGCGQTLYEFQFATSHVDQFWISEYGDHMYDEMEFLSDPAAPPYWQADPDGPMIACQPCHYDGILGDRHYMGPREDTGEYALRGFDGKTDRLTQYSVGGDCGTVVRDDWYWFSMDDRDDKWNPLGEIFPFDAEEFMLPYSRGRSDAKQELEEYDYTIVGVGDVVNFSRQPPMPDEVALQTKKYGSSRDVRELTDILEAWSCSTEPHPEFDFRYLIAKGSEVFVHEDNADEVRLALLEQTLRNRKRTKGREAISRLSEIHNFVCAVEEDEYAELELSTGDVLITDWESDDTFLPYVEPMGTHADKHPTDILCDISEAIEDALPVTVYHVEWDNNNSVYYPEMDRPEKRPVTGDRLH